LIVCGLAWPGAGGFAGLLDAVVVVPGAFAGSGEGTFAAVGDEQVRDLGEVVGKVCQPSPEGAVGFPS
jgi:hypothetical protein